MATPFDGILDQARDLISTRLNQAIAGMLDKADESLSTLIAESQNREERELYQETKDVAVEQREIIEKQFQTRYLGDFRQRSNRARKIGQSSGAAEFSLDSLELISQEDLEETLKFNDMVAKLRAYCHEELVALDQRVGVLLGDANLQADDNPFSPQVICDAYKHCCRKLDTSVGVRRVLLRLFDDHVVDDIRSVYKAVNALLVQNSILPKIRYAIPRKDGRKAAPGAPAGAEEDEDEAPAKGAGNGGAAQDLFAMLQNLVAKNVGGGPGIGAGPAAPAGAGAAATVLQGAELIGSLTKIQHGDVSAVAGANVAIPAGAPGTTNVLHELKGTSVGAGMGQMDLMTLDIVAMLFDQLFDDPKVPNGVKGLIGRLQIPILKVAIADKAFFSTKTHPARQLLDTMGELALRLPEDFNTSNPLFARLETILQGLIEGFQDNVEIFNTVRGQLEALVAEEDQRVEQERLTAAKRAEELENLALAKSVAEEEVRTRVQVQDLPGPVLEFIVQQWLKVLLLVHVKEGKESAAWNEAVEAMDSLIWTLQPKATIEERRKLAAVVPGLLKRLAAGLKAAGIEDEVRVQFFAALIKYHTQAISAPAKAEPKPAGKGEGDSKRRPSSKKTPAQPPVSLDFSAPITVKDPFSGGNVSVDSHDFASGNRDAKGADLLDNLAIGTWVEFRESGDPSSRQPVKYIFVSPRKTRYFFAVDQSGKNIIQCTRGEISRRFRTGEAVIMDGPPEDSLFDRIMSGLVGKLRASGAPH